VFPVRDGIGDDRDRAIVLQLAFVHGDAERVPNTGRVCGDEDTRAIGVRDGVTHGLT